MKKSTFILTLKKAAVKYKLPLILVGVFLLGGTAGVIASSKSNTSNTEAIKETTVSKSESETNNDKGKSDSNSDQNDDQSQTKPSSQSSTNAPKSSQATTQSTSSSSSQPTSQPTASVNSLTYSANGCVLTAVGPPGATLEYGSYNEGRGGQETTTIPPSGTITLGSNGGSGLTTVFANLISNGQTLVTKTASVSPDTICLLN